MAIAKDDIFIGEINEPSSKLYNEDLAPAKERTWGVYSLLAMWMSDVHSVGGYTFAAGLFFLGLTGWQVLLALLIGITIVMYLTNMTGKAGVQLGVPYPVLARISFGVFGGNIPALIRGIIAVFWYGIQTYLASVAVSAILLTMWPGMESLTTKSFLGLDYLGWMGFLILWFVQLVIMAYGMEIIRKFDNFAGPIVYVLMVFLIIWILIESKGNISLNLSTNQLAGGQALLMFFSAIALVVAYFSTIMLNVSDFTRFTPNLKTMRKANFWGLPVNFTAFSIATVIVTAGSYAVFGKYIFDPVELVARIPNKFALVVGAFGFATATVGINIVANLVSPAYDLANLAPKHINFRRGGIITAVLSVVVLPWKIYANPLAVNYFLGGLAAFLGPIFAIMMIDYYLIKKANINVQSLYQEGSAHPYWYQGGYNKKAIISFLLGTLVSAPVALVPTFAVLAPFSWFIGVAIAGLVYYNLMKGERRMA